MLKNLGKKVINQVYEITKLEITSTFCLHADLKWLFEFKWMDAFSVKSKKKQKLMFSVQKNENKYEGLFWYSRVQFAEAFKQEISG